MAEHRPESGWYSRWTQKTANGLPSWNKIRRQRDTVGQQLINAAAGKYIEHAWDEMERALRNRYPGTVEVNQPDLVMRIDIPHGIEANQPTEITNQVLNSSFEIWPNQSELAQFWQYTGTGTAKIVACGFVGNRALKLSASLGQTVKVYQDLDLEIPAGQEWTFSAWYKINSTLNLTAPATGFGIEVVGYLVDNTTEVLRTAFATNTNDRATKISVTGSFTKAVSKVRISFVVNHTAGFTFSDTVTVDLSQAEEGKVATSWRPHPLDNWPHVTVFFDLAPILIENGNRAQFVESMQDFWLQAIPTRMSYGTQITDAEPADTAPIPVGGVTSYGTAGRFVETDVYDEDWLYTIEAISHGGTHELRMIGTEVPDILGTFGMAFRNWRSWFEDDTSIVLEAITFFGSRLWVVHKKNDFLGVQRRYLSVVDIKTPWPRPSYFEVLTTLELPVPSLSTLITRLEFRYDDQQHIYVGDGSTTHVYTLHYDYFTIQGRSIHLREDPATISIIEAEPRRLNLTEAQDASKMNRTTRR